MSFDVVMIGTALVMGLAGSLHCAGMCGPLMLVLPFGGGNGRAKARTAVYHSGRLITYAALGGIFGLLGQGISLAGWQQGLSIGTGVVILLMALFPVLGRKVNPTGAIARWSGGVKQRWGAVLRNGKSGSWLLLGMLNGLLPCGLVYLALAGALASHTTTGGMVFMLVFGLGTFPMLAAIGLLQAKLRTIGHGVFSNVLSVVTILVGVLLVVRGLGLGIPYLSPVAEACGATLGGCCHQ